jgi:hypothetical protein
MVFLAWNIGRLGITIMHTIKQNDPEIKISSCCFTCKKCSERRSLKLMNCIGIVATLIPTLTSTGNIIVLLKTEPLNLNGEPDNGFKDFYSIALPKLFYLLLICVTFFSSGVLFFILYTYVSLLYVLKKFSNRSGSLVNEQKALRKFLNWLMSAVIFRAVVCLAFWANPGIFCSFETKLVIYEFLWIISNVLTMFPVFYFHR